MISQKEMLNIIRTEAIEHGGVQEVPAPQHGGTNSFHSPKRPARGTQEMLEPGPAAQPPAMQCDLRLVRKANGSFEWID